MARTARSDVRTPVRRTRERASGTRTAGGFTGRAANHWPVAAGTILRRLLSRPAAARSSLLELQSPPYIEATDDKGGRVMRVAVAAAAAVIATVFSLLPAHAGPVTVPAGTKVLLRFETPVGSGTIK